MLLLAGAAAGTAPGAASRNGTRGRGRGTEPHKEVGMVSKQGGRRSRVRREHGTRGKGLACTAVHTAISHFSEAISHFNYPPHVKYAGIAKD
jgi:hypothetical protein